jgi:cytochrome c
MELGTLTNRLDVRPYSYCGDSFKRLVSAAILKKTKDFRYMDSFEWNKIFGAVLGTALGVFGLSVLSEAVFHGEAPEKPGFAVVEAEAPAAGGGEAAGEAKPIGVLLASADVAKGAAGAKACLACHAFEKGGANKVGPALWDVVERPIGAHEGFAYSEQMAALKDKKWTYEELNAFILNPKAHIKGTKMAFAGIKNDAKRADLIAYLGSLSDAPKPFPPAQ